MAIFVNQNVKKGFDHRIVKIIDFFIIENFGDNRKIASKCMEYVAIKCDNRNFSIIDFFDN